MALVYLENVRGIGDHILWSDYWRENIFETFHACIVTRRGYAYDTTSIRHFASFSKFFFLHLCWLGKGLYRFPESMNDRVITGLRCIWRNSNHRHCIHNMIHVLCSRRPSVDYVSVRIAYNKTNLKHCKLLDEMFNSSSGKYLPIFLLEKDPKLYDNTLLLLLLKLSINSEIEKKF